MEVPFKQSPKWELISEGGDISSRWISSDGSAHQKKVREPEGLRKV